MTLIQQINEVIEQMWMLCPPNSTFTIALTVEDNKRFHNQCRDWMGVVRSTDVEQIFTYNGCRVQVIENLNIQKIGSFVIRNEVHNKFNGTTLSYIDPMVMTIADLKFYNSSNIKELNEKLK